MKQKEIESDRSLENSLHVIQNFSCLKSTQAEIQTNPEHQNKGGNFIPFTRKQASRYFSKCLSFHTKSQPLMKITSEYFQQTIYMCITAALPFSILLIYFLFIFKQSCSTFQTHFHNLKNAS